MRKWLPLFAACLGTFMLLIDVTIVNVALPDIAVDLRAGLSSLQWVVDGYALALAALLLVLGSLADRVGAKRAYLAGLVLFAVASLGCGVAGTATNLIAGRVLQGGGGAAMFATTLSLLHATYTGRDRGIAFSIWGAVTGAAAGIGVVLGGVLTDLLSWRWIFFVNLPIAVVAIALTATVFPASARRGDRAVDVPGMLTFATAATALTYGVIRGGEHGWSDGPAMLALLLGVGGARRGGRPAPPGARCCGAARRARVPRSTNPPPPHRCSPWPCCAIASSGRRCSARAGRPSRLSRARPWCRSGCSSSCG
ncbi:MFS transporter [Nocardia brasiliensis]|uniref:MFS transporter n=1 Tax=Nocardia brasiliensis TaxID=37326 RepID=UPI002454E13D|nr:MFS transporter [Nocardia brasiliensis]